MCFLRWPLLECNQHTVSYYGYRLSDQTSKQVSNAMLTRGPIGYKTKMDIMDSEASSFTQCNHPHMLMTQLWQFLLDTSLKGCCGLQMVVEGLLQELTNGSRHAGQ